MVGVVGIEPTQTRSRTEWPTNSLHPDGSTQNRTEIRGFKDRCPTIERCSSGRNGGISNPRPKPYESSVPPWLAALDAGVRIERTWSSL